MGKMDSRMQRIEVLVLVGIAVMVGLAYDSQSDSLKPASGV
jgi:hypothetical protein